MRLLLLLVATAFAVDALQWHQGDFNGQLKWATNCDFDDDGGGGDLDNNSIDQSSDESPLPRPRIIRLEEDVGREQCGWLCWANVECSYFTHSDNVCRLMTTTDDSGRETDVHQPMMAVPYLAESDTVCGYVPSRSTGSHPRY